MSYEAVIGLEVHVQLLTKSKMFCSCSADYQSAPPNTRVCPVCLAMPGVLPVINKKAVEYTIMTGLALDCTISDYTKFDRKNYPYPDLMKGYQISQYDAPIAKGGWLSIEVNGIEKKVGITRVHLEEDVAKLFHRSESGGESYSLLDVNRSGVPLMEIVSEPDLRSPEDARQYLMRLRSILQYMSVSTGNMEEGSFRCDANVSIRPKGSTELFTRVEVKNMNSFRSVFRALEFEIQRQERTLREGGRIVQETRGWVEERSVTVSQRTKEYAHDYRYFPEPDLPPLKIWAEWVQQVRARIPELPEARKTRFVSEYGLPEYDAALLTASKANADFFEECLRLKPLDGAAQQHLAKAVSIWMLGEMTRLLNATGKEMSEMLVRPHHIMEIQAMIESGTLSTTMAKEVFEEIFNNGSTPGEIVAKRGLVQISDLHAMSAFVEEAIYNSPQAVKDYLEGKETALRFLTGQVMKVTRGKANPTMIGDILKKKLETMRQG